jgi:hypothetical protein
MNEAIMKPLSGRKAVFGIISMVWNGITSSLLLFGLVWFIMNLKDIIYSAALDAAFSAPYSSGGEHDDYSIAGFAISTFYLMGLICAVVGLVRAERPRWPAITGLFLWILPIVVLFSLFVLGSNWNPAQ